MLKPLLLSCALLGCLGLQSANAAELTAKQKETQRQEIRQKSQSILKDLYRVSPSAKGAISSAAGYAVFSNFGMKILFAGGGTGSGMVVKNANQQKTYMKMLELQAGLGFGIKSFRVIFVFENAKVLDNFINSGWSFSGQGTAAAKSGSTGLSYQGAISVSPGVWMYQLTDTGLALELTGKGTKYYKNDALN
nr:hypothetical protein [uncultured Deefgea sp.]